MPLWGTSVGESLGGREAAMRALIWHGPRSITLGQIPEPESRPGHAIARVEAVGICGSELSGYLGESSIRKPPLVMGHEFCRRVEEVPAGHGLVRGQRVTVNLLISCDECSACHRGAQNLCARREVIGAHRPGAFADLVAVPIGNCYPVFSEMPPATAALAEPLACSSSGAARSVCARWSWPGRPVQGSSRLRIRTRRGFTRPVPGALRTCSTELTTSPRPCGC